MKEALLVIDVQNEYFSGCMPVTHPHGSFINVLQAMDAAHAAKVPVVVIQHSSPGPDAAAFCRGTKAWELHPDVMKRPRDVLIEKLLPGSFTRTNLGSWLRERAIDSLTISGYMTQMCCDRDINHHQQGRDDQGCRPAPCNPCDPADAVLAGHDDN